MELQKTTIRVDIEDMEKLKQFFPSYNLSRLVRDMVRVLNSKDYHTLAQLLIKHTKEEMNQC